MMPESLTSQGMPSHVRRPRVVVIDDHLAVRRGLRWLIGTWPEFEACGEGASLSEGLELVAALQPDVVVTDLSLPDAEGRSVVRALRSAAPRAGLLVFSMREERFHAARALEDGASGYLMKGAEPTELRQALRAVARGRRHVSARMAAELLATRPGRFCSRGDLLAPAANELTERQQDVLQLLGEGHAVADVAARLGLSAKTVETHCAHIKERLGLRTARDLLCYAVTSGSSY